MGAEYTRQRQIWRTCSRAHLCEAHVIHIVYTNPNNAMPKEGIFSNDSNCSEADVDIVVRDYAPGDHGQVLSLLRQLMLSHSERCYYDTLNGTKPVQIAIRAVCYGLAAAVLGSLSQWIAFCIVYEAVIIAEVAGAMWAAYYWYGYEGSSSIGGAPKLIFISINQSEHP